MKLWCYGIGAKMNKYETEVPYTYSPEIWQSATAVQLGKNVFSTNDSGLIGCPYGNKWTLTSTKPTCKTQSQVDCICE